jgi:mRNA interferase MazF
MRTAEVAPGTVARVPFPRTGADARQHRPAPVVATAGSDAAPFLRRVVMIPSASSRRWSGDVAVPDVAAAGLPIPPVVRTGRIATIDLARAEARGQVAPETLAAARGATAHRLGL